jgi:hypothetical protein
MARTAAAKAAAKPAAKKPVAAKKAATKAAPAKAPAVKKTVAPAKTVRAKATSPAKVAQQAARAIAAPVKTARTKAVPAAVPAARPHLVRDSFTMPEQEYAVLGTVKQACLKAGFEVKKSELLRIGVALLGQLDMASLRAVLDSLPQLKTGRPPGE